MPVRTPILNERGGPLSADGLSFEGGRAWMRQPNRCRSNDDRSRTRGGDREDQPVAFHCKNGGCTRASKRDWRGARVTRPMPEPRICRSNDDRSPPDAGGF